MSKGTALGIIALILGASGLMIGVFTLLETSEQTAWYSSSTTSIYSNPPYIWQSIPNLTITFDLNANEKVYFSYLGSATAHAIGSSSFIQVNIVIDGILFTNTSMSVATNSTSDFIVAPISLQYFTDTLSAGRHNVTIEVVGSYAGNYIGSHSLFVQKFPA
jgi:hypothetical protein